MEGRVEGCTETGEGTGREGGTGSRGIRTGIRSVKGGNGEDSRVNVIGL